MFGENTSLWEQYAPLIAHAEKPSRYLGQEWGSVQASDKPNADYHAVLIYPDVYEVGQANQAIAILYDCFNKDSNILCERAYLPWVDMAAKMREKGLPLVSLETYTPLADFDFIGITLPHELAATNVVELLDLAGIPLHADERAEDDPLVFGGGPCAYNPEPFAPFFDAIFIGEGEQVDLVAAHLHRTMRAAGASRGEILRELSHVPGVYVPSLYSVEWEFFENDKENVKIFENRTNIGRDASEDDAFQSLFDGNPGAFAPKSGSGCSDNVLNSKKLTAKMRFGKSATGRYSTVRPLYSDVPAVVEKQVIQDFDALDALPQPIVPYSELVHDRLAIEILRGCNRGCRFCQAGMIYRPVRERNADTIISAVARGLACTGYDEVSLTSLSSTDHSTIEEQLRRLNRRFAGTALGVSLPSQRVDAFGVELARLAAGEKKGGLTLAPEAGTQRLRDSINKGVREEDLLNAVTSAFEAGWRRLKLYFMIGLPGETDDDVRGIGELCRRVYAAAKDSVPDNQRGNVRMTVSVALFVPKPVTPFQWDGQIPYEQIQHRIEVLKKSFPRKGIDLHWHDSATSYVEAVLARGGRECAALVESAWRHGARFDAWTEQFNFEAWTTAGEECGVPIMETATREYEEGAPLPWSHISCGVRESFLREERAKAKRGETTPDCTFGMCSVCGVCQDLRTAEGGRVRNATESKRVASDSEKARMKSIMGTVPNIDKRDTPGERGGEQA